MHLIKDVLDNQVVDQQDRKMGKVDGIVIEWRADGPPRLLYIEIGPAPLAARLHPRLGAWVAARLRRFGPARGEPARIPWASVQDTGINVKLNRDADTTTALAWENWLREHIVRRIPGGA